MSHTPRPWEWENATPEIGSTTAPDEYEALNGGPGNGVVLHQDGFGNICVPKIADARLIAAAPELLQATRNATAMIRERGIDDERTNLLFHAVATLEAAIAKATAPTQPSSSAR